MKHTFLLFLSFVEHKITPTLLKSYINQMSFQNVVARFVLAFLPLFSTIPIQDVSLLTYALSHKNVNAASDSETNASSGLTASVDDTYIIDTRKEPSRSQDLYTSEEQRRRDQYEIDEDNWHEVAFEEVNGASTCRLALHSDWIINQGYAVDGIVEMNLPEQGISGPFKITAIKHILPQKRPVDEDPDDEREYKPVTGLFTHRSDQVHTLAFASADGSQEETLGVTAAHPIFSTTYHDWRLAGELEAGEKVLTYNGEATVISNERKPGNETVYNLEVKDLHNFLVGDLGVVAHNTGNCWKTWLDILIGPGKWERQLLPGKKWAHKVKGNNPYQHEINQMESLGEYLKEGVTALSKGFGGIDCVTKGGKVISMKNITSVSNDGLKKDIGLLFKKDFDNKSNYPDVEKITGVITAKNFTKAQIKAAIKEKKGSWQSIDDRFYDYFIEGSDESIIMTAAQINN